MCQVLGCTVSVWVARHPPRSQSFPSGSGCARWSNRYRLAHMKLWFTTGSLALDEVVQPVRLLNLSVELAQFSGECIGLGAQVRDLQGRDLAKL